jgi:ribosomal protein S2
MLLNYFFNKNLIHKIAARGGNFLFLTLRKEYYDAIRENSDRCFQTALLWQPSLLGNLDTRSRIFEKSYDLDFESFKPTDVFVLFDNQKFRSTRIMKEIDNFPGVPLISVLDTDSIMLDGVFPIVGNDDSSIAIYFYSLFVSYSIGSSGKIMSDFVDD